MDGLMIRALRIQQGFSQGELAKTIGISQPRLSEMETGTRPITPRVRIRIAQIFDIDDKAMEMLRKVRLAEQIFS